MNKILAICLVIAAVGMAAIFIFKIPINSVLIYGAILLCPLMHMFMMNHGEHSNSKDDKASQDHTLH